MAKNQYDWVKKVSRALFEASKAPATEVAVKPFPWKEFAKSLAQTFALENVSLEVSSVRWGSPKEFLSGIGRKPHIQPVSLNPLEGMAYWVIGKREISQLLSLLINKDPKAVKLTDEDVHEAFYSFLAVEVLHHLEKLSFMKKITPRLGEEEELPKEAGFIMDITLSAQGYTFVSRLIASSHLHQDWIKYFSSEEHPVVIPDELAEKLETSLHLVMGRTRLKLDEWEQVRPGDCLILDGCTWELGDGAVPVMCTVNNRALFKGEIKGGTLKLLDVPNFEEVQSMIGEGQ